MKKLLTYLLMLTGMNAFAAATQPNILLILSDDHAKKAIGCYGNTDQLATVLEQNYPGHTKVINGALGGANSRWGRSALDEKVLQHNPDTVFIEFSTME